jgi:hypothetical protein
LAPSNLVPPLDEAVEAAITRVLEREAAARDAIARANADALDIAEDARAHARSLSLRTEARIRAIRAAFERKASAEVAALDDEAAALESRHVLLPEEIAAMERAVAVLAAELTGGCP